MIGMIGVRASYWLTGTILTVLGVAVANLILGVFVPAAFAVGVFLLKAALVGTLLLGLGLVLWLARRRRESRR